MSNLKSQLILSAICLVLGVMLVTQFNTQRDNQKATPQSPGDQATYISDLYRANQDLQSELDDLKAEATKYASDDTQGSSKLVDMLDNLHRLRMANGEVEVSGPGVSVVVSGTVSVSTLQDLTNELRNAGAEAIALSGVRLITRSVIGESSSGIKNVDGQTIVPPYRLDAIGDSHTLAAALQRKGGLISQIMQSQGNKIEIKVDERSEKGNLITLPKSTINPIWQYAQPSSNTDQ